MSVHKYKPRATPHSLEERIIQNVTDAEKGITRAKAGITQTHEAIARSKEALERVRATKVQRKQPHNAA